MVVWCCGCVMVTWCGGVVVTWCGGVELWWSKPMLRYYICREKCPHRKAQKVKTMPTFLAHSKFFAIYLYSI